MKIVANDYEPKDIIKIIREWTELTQKDFGKSINRSLRGIQDYEAGRRCYNINTLLDIANKHNITITIEKK
ncbi:MAG: helix-turn-helix domain-containing protein [Clostridia bacterium]